jgi:Pyridoxamine 5'-phosphate oxidase
MDFDQRAAADLLAEPHVGIFAVASPSGPPAAVPVWYSYTVGGRVWIVTEATSRKRRLLERSGSATLVVDEVAPRTRYVSVDCELVDAHPATAEDQRELASRYVSADALEAYLATVAPNLPHEQRITLQPTRWRFADFGPASPH